MADYAQMDVTKLEDELLVLRKEQFKLRMQYKTGQLHQTHLIKQVRRDIARVKTFLNQKKAK